MPAAQGRQCSTPNPGRPQLVPALSATSPTTHSLPSTPHHYPHTTPTSGSHTLHPPTHPPSNHRSPPAPGALWNEAGLPSSSGASGRPRGATSSRPTFVPSLRSSTRRRPPTTCRTQRQPFRRWAAGAAGVALVVVSLRSDLPCQCEAVGPCHAACFQARWLPFFNPPTPTPPQHLCRRLALASTTCSAALRRGRWPAAASARCEWLGSWAAGTVRCPAQRACRAAGLCVQRSAVHCCVAAYQQPL